MSLRLAFVQEALRLRQQDSGSHRALCATYHIAPKTGYKWLARFALGGPAALADASRAPHGSPTALWAARPEVVDLILVLRLRHPRWGARKLRHALALLHPEAPWGPWPAPSTITRVLHAAELIAPRTRRPSGIGPHEGTGPLVAATPNAVWTIDYKGEFKTRDGRWVFPLTVLDAHSRYLLGCQAHPAISAAGTKACLTRLFQAHGLPEVLRSDNGAPFASAAAPRRLSRLSLWWLKLGIRPCLGRPQHPEDNARHERMHQTLKAEATRPPAATLAAQQRQLCRFQHEYNTERPHESLAGQPPAACYHDSPRPMPRTLPAPVYPGDYLTRRVSPVGTIKHAGHAIFISQIFQGEALGLRPDPTTDGVLEVYFGSLWLGTFDQRTLTFAKAGTPAGAPHRVLPMSSV